MIVYLNVKALSKRRPLIERMPFAIDGPVATSDTLVEYIVRHNVDEYNKKAVDAPLFPYLTDDRLEDGARAGKVGFGDRKNENAQDADKAVENALTCFRDGLFRMFVNDAEAGPGEGLQISEGDEVTFIRLAMLAGRLW
ncbi:MAG: hypothetical protein FWH47_04665 [Methanomassiliicoccaceae archaeon]|nr:hypothetical protein [Methanomassiliicoccaceae archaeon]